MYPLDYVPDDIILVWLKSLREKTISRAILWATTHDTITTQLNSRYSFVIRRYKDSYFVSVRESVHDGAISTVDWTTIINQSIRKKLLARVRAFETDIRRYAAAGQNWQAALGNFHSLITLP